MPGPVGFLFSFHKAFQLFAGFRPPLPRFRVYGDGQILFSQGAKMNLKSTWMVGTLLFGLLPHAASADLIDPITGGTLEAMPAVNALGSAGPQSFGSGITWTSTNSNALFGYTDNYGFGSNGSWRAGAHPPMAGINSSTASMTFAFHTPQEAVGGFLNYAPGFGTATIAVFGSSHNLIESSTLTFLTGGADNSGMFLGFRETTADISYFTLSGAFVGLTDLTVAGAVPTPVPSSLVMSSIVFGMFGLFWAGKRLRQAAAGRTDPLSTPSN